MAMDELKKEELESLEQVLNSLRDSATPPLDLHFTQRVMDRIHPPSVWRRVFGAGRLPLRLAVGTVLTAGLVVGLYFGSDWRREKRAIESSAVSPTIEVPGRKIYQVRFLLNRPEAGEVRILGDFTQWNAMTLTKDSKGNFTGEVTLPEGTYAYGFMVDGKEWVPDQTAHGFIPDGFGRINSIINL